jgi:surfactin synthase thioesterase subunit
MTVLSGGGGTRPTAGGRSDRPPARPAVGGPVRAYCVPHAGGSADAYRGWSRSADWPDVEFVPVELPGRGTRRAEPLPATLAAVTDELLGRLASRPADERFVLLGHSMGASVAYETARRLAAAGRPAPELLVVSGSRPPGAADLRRLRVDSDEELLRRLRDLGGTPSEILQHPGLLRMVLPPLRADLAMLADYQAAVDPTPVPGPVLALGGAADPAASPRWIAAWRALTTGRFRHRILPGGHFFLHEHRSTVLAEIGTQVATGPGAGSVAEPDRIAA